jgi:hypothetical protein
VKRDKLSTALRRRVRHQPKEAFIRAFFLPDDGAACHHPKKRVGAWAVRSSVSVFIRRGGCAITDFNLRLSSTATRPTFINQKTAVDGKNDTHLDVGSDPSFLCSCMLLSSHSF